MIDSLIKELEGEGYTVNVKRKNVFKTINTKHANYKVNTYKYKKTNKNYLNTIKDNENL